MLHVVYFQRWLTETDQGQPELEDTLVDLLYGGSHRA
jgi:hypothetical protein